MEHRGIFRECQGNFCVIVVGIVVITIIMISQHHKLPLLGAALACWLGVLKVDKVDQKAEIDTNIANNPNSFHASRSVSRSK